MITDFHQFLDKKGRETVKQLRLIGEMLGRHGMKVQNFLEGDDDPYIFVQNPEAGSSFGGLRIYRVGEMLAYRVQKEAQTYPYGRAYGLKIEDMYNDLISDDIKEEEAGKRVIESVGKEIKKFFEISQKAERDNQRQAMTASGDPMNRVLITTNGADYSTNLTQSGA